MTRQPIRKSDMKIGIYHCSSCGSMGATAGLQLVEIKTSPSSSQTVSLCKECSEDMALFLIRLWAEPVNDLPVLRKSPAEILLEETEGAYESAIALQKQLVTLLHDSSDPGMKDFLRQCVSDVGSLIRNVYDAKRLQEDQEGPV